MSTHTDFATAFTPGVTVADTDGVRYALRQILLGELEIASGAVGVGDAFTGLGALHPPTGTIPAGRYAVELSLARFEDDGVCAKGDERVAAARVRFSDARVARWVRVDGAGVDSGTCAFADGNWEPSEAEGDALEALLQKSALGPSVMACRFDAARPIFAFSSGHGDGIYPAFWGLDAAGAPVVLCLDLMLLITAVTVDVALGWPLRRGAIRDKLLSQHDVRARVPWLTPNRLEYSGGGDLGAFPRWRLPDGTWRRPQGQPIGPGRRAVSLVNRPPGAELVLRITVAEKACERIA